jgi:predicted GIY-YIG superfamily endonuclease
LNEGVIDVIEHADVYYVYIVRCVDESLYVGHACNVEQRVAVHNDGLGAAWTACRRPVVLAYMEACPTEYAAIQRERQIKRWSHAKKMALVRGEQGRLKALAKRRVFEKKRKRFEQIL